MNTHYLNEYYKMKQSKTFFTGFIIDEPQRMHINNNALTRTG